VILFDGSLMCRLSIKNEFCPLTNQEPNIIGIDKLLLNTENNYSMLFGKASAMFYWGNHSTVASYGTQIQSI